MKALKVAQREQQWKLFSDLDTQDEAEMLHLAVFMQTLIDSVAATGKESGFKSTLSDDDYEEEEEEKGFNAIDLDHISIAETVGAGNKDVELDLSGSKIDARMCEAIVECYRHGRKLSRKTIVKILRRAYKMVQKQSNVSAVTLNDGDKLTVVGDLHGQLSDLMFILDEAGFPTVNNKFVFNGDFVDRGEKGLEIVVILFAFYVAEGPNVVCLNRGNHEDIAVCRVYGFEAEVKEKYDDLLFEMVAEVFNFVPLFSLVNHSVFVVHGGLFHTPNVGLAELEEINRADYYVKPPVPYPQNIRGLAPAEARKEFMKQLQRDAMWSDPTEELGCYLNPRGAGVSFGPDLAAAFMEKNGIDMVVRSHECVYSGFDLPYAAAVKQIAPNMGVDARQQGHVNPPGCPLLCTLFSASNYIGGDNEGAFLMFLTHSFSDSQPVSARSNLHYAVKHYKTSDSDHGELNTFNQISLRELIMKRKGALMSAFEAKDAKNAGVVSRLKWAEVMQRVTMIKIRWLSIIETISPAESLTPSSVDYKKFMASFSIAHKIDPKTDMKVGQTEAHLDVMDDMYGQRRKLETLFYFFDSNGDGVISLEEFREGCAALNKNLHPDLQLTDIEHTLKMMDFDGSGTIDINEFFETFRLLDAKDGKVDGVISLAKKTAADEPAQQGINRKLSEKAKKQLVG